MTEGQAAQQRSRLPVRDTSTPRFVTCEAKNVNASAAPIEQLTLGWWAIVLIDDAGFSTSSAFGDRCRVPDAEALASDGLECTRSPATGICPRYRALFQCVQSIIRGV